VHLAWTWLNSHLFCKGTQKSRQFNQAANAGVKFFMKLIIILTFAFHLLGCGNSTEAQINEIVSYKNIWLASSQNKDYKYSVTITSPSSDKSRTYVVKVISSKSSLSNLPELATVESLYKYAFSAIQNNDKKVVVKYHQKLGYPLSISVTNSRNMDSSSSIKVADFEYY
jgi:hypothetical protein